MEYTRPLRLLNYNGADFCVVNTSHHDVESFDIISYRWGDVVPSYRCDIEGVGWNVTISSNKLDDIKRLMKEAKIKFLWADCVCINQDNESEKANEIARMNRYYQDARQCHILLEMMDPRQPQCIIDDLKAMDHIISHIEPTAIASQTTLSEGIRQTLREWEERQWKFPLDEEMVASTTIEKGVLNCYATCIGITKSLFDNLYFSRVWTFQEMLLGRNITIWGMNEKTLSHIGNLITWMELATISWDKATRLQSWIERPWERRPKAVELVLAVIEFDKFHLDFLHAVVGGIDSARQDISQGGTDWWKGNHRGISNIFSAVSILPRKATQQGDIFRGFLGVFSGLFTPEEIQNEMAGDDMERIAFTFFKQLSLKTGRAWTRLAISPSSRKEWEWIPMVVNSSRIQSTDCFAKVDNLGELDGNKVKTKAMIDVIGLPKQYIRIQLRQGRGDGFQFQFKGCNCGATVTKGFFRKRTIVIPTNDKPQIIHSNQTGKALVECATILGTIMDPGCNLVEYRTRLLTKLRPSWRVSDPAAKPPRWIERCVSGDQTWEQPKIGLMKSHNMSKNYVMNEITSCGSRLENDSTAEIICEVTALCGCSVTAPFTLIFEAIMAVKGSSLGDTSVSLDEHNRITIKDGLGLVQAGDVGKSFCLVAFGGDVNAYKSFALGCKDEAGEQSDRSVMQRLPWPRGRAMVRDDFMHSSGMIYGYVKTGGSGNLLIAKTHRFTSGYRIIGVCIDEDLPRNTSSGSTCRDVRIK